MLDSPSFGDLRYKETIRTLNFNFFLGWITSNHSQKTAINEEISPLVRQAIKRGKEEAAKQLLESSRGPLQKSERTGFGSLASTFKQKKTETILKGLVRGKKEIPSWYTSKPLRGESVVAYGETKAIHDQTSPEEAELDFKNSHARAAGSPTRPKFRKDFAPTTASWDSGGDDMDHGFVLQGTQRVTPRLSLNLTPLLPDKTTDRPETADETAEGPYERSTTLKEDTLGESAKERSSQSNRNKPLIYGKTDNEVKNIQEEEDVAEQADKISAGGSRKEHTPSVKTKVKEHDGSFLQGRATIEDPAGMTKHHKTKINLGFRRTESFLHGNKADNKRYKGKKRKAHSRTGDQEDLDTSKDSHLALAVVAGICAGIMVFLFIMTGLALLW